MKIGLAALYLSSVIVLASCGTAAAVHGQWSSSMNQESLAWKQHADVTANECLARPVPREKALAQADCMEKYAREIVMPVAVAPDLFGKFLTDAREVAINYKKGKIDNDEANLELQRKFQSYSDAIAARGNAVIGRAQAQDAARAQSFNEAFAGSFQQNTAPTAPAPNRMKTTNCHAFGNMLQCTEF